MRILKTGLIAALAIGGLVALTNVASAQDANKEGKKGRYQTPEQRLEALTKELNLTDAQKPKVKAVLEDGAKKREEIRNADPSERREKARALIEEQNKKLKEILTPEQYEKFRKLESERRGGGKKKEDGGGKDDNKKE